MSTFLTILAVIVALIISGVVTIGILLRKGAVKLGVFVLRKGTADAVARAAADWVPADLRAEITAINDEALALPEVRIFNAGSVFSTGKALTLRLAAASEKLDAAKPVAPAIDVTAADVTTIDNADAVAPVDPTAPVAPVDPTAPVAPVAPTADSTATGSPDAK